MTIQHLATLSDNIIELFRNHTYEKYVLDIMNKSSTVFPGTYCEVIEQAHGECDFIDIKEQIKYDAKLPFLSKQIQMLTSGENHAPMIREWILQMMDEASDYDPIAMRDNPDYDISNTKLYKIMKNAIEKDKPDENIIFFLPYPMVLSISDSTLLQFAGNYLSAIYNKLRTDINLNGREIFVIYPASKKNQFALRKLSSYYIEYINYNKFEPFFSYEIV